MTTIASSFADVLCANPNLAKYNKLISILGDTINNLNIPFPRIAVAGTQSAGKSSLLQAILGHRIFPADAGMCTRAPFRMEMQGCTEEQFQAGITNYMNLLSNAEDRARLRGARFCVTFDNAPGKAFFDPIEIQNHIVETTNRLTNGNLDTVSEKEIGAKFFGVGLPPLTIIDLPGHIVHHSGNPQLPQAIERLIIKYIEQKHTTILAVHDASVDAQNDPVLALVLHKIDPQFSRTIAVLTKMDALQQPAQVANVTQDIRTYSKSHSTFACKLYDNGVKDKSVADIVKDEAAFFSSTPLMNNLHAYFSDNLGSTNLTQYLCSHLDSVVRVSMDDIKKHILELERKWTSYLLTLPKPVTQCEATTKCTELTKEYVHGLSKRLLDRHHQMDFQPKLRTYFEKTWAKEIEKVKNAFDKFPDDRLNEMLQNIQGINFLANSDISTLFEPVFIECMGGQGQSLNHNKLPKLKQVCVGCLDHLEQLLLQEGIALLDEVAAIPTPVKSKATGNPMFGSAPGAQEETLQNRQGKFKQFPEFHREVKSQWAQLLAAQKQKTAESVASLVDSCLVFYEFSDSRSPVPKPVTGQVTTATLKQYFKDCFEAYILHFIRTQVPRLAIFAMRDEVVALLEDTLRSHFTGLIGEQAGGDPNALSKFMQVLPHVKAERAMAEQNVSKFRECLEVLRK